MRDLTAHGRQASAPRATRVSCGPVNCVRAAPAPPGRRHRGTREPERAAFGRSSVQPPPVMPNRRIVSERHPARQGAIRSAGPGNMARVLSRVPPLVLARSEVQTIVSHIERSYDGASAANRDQTTTSTLRRPGVLPASAPCIIPRRPAASLLGITEAR